MAPDPPRKSATRGKVPSPQEVAPGVFVGGWDDATHFTGAKFCVMDDPPQGLPGTVHIPIYDEVRNAPILPNLEILAQRVRLAHDVGAPRAGVLRPRDPSGAARRGLVPASVRAADRGGGLRQVRSVRPKIEHARDWIGHVEGLEP